MKYVPTLLTLFMTIVPITLQANTKGSSLLFKHTGKKLSRFEKQQIYSLLASDTGIVVSDDGKNLIEETCGVIDFKVGIIDLNRDNKAEVSILGGNICLSGMTGLSLWLFIKDKSGNYQRNFGFPAANYKTLKTKSKGYPDLLIGGRGFCFPVWRWDGNQYQHYRSEPMEKDGCNWRLKYR
jgi:hypothetical protein